MFGDSLADTTSHDAPPPPREFPTLLCLPSPTGNHLASVSADARSSMVLIPGSGSSTDGSSRHESELLFVATSTSTSTAAMVPIKGHSTTKEGTTHCGNTQSGGAANVAVQLPKYLNIAQPRVITACSVGAATANHMTLTPLTKVVNAQVQASCIASTSSHDETRKRKIACVGAADIDKKNESLNSGRQGVKRICREKTGTDWQSVLDITKYGEEQRGLRRQNDPSI